METLSFIWELVTSKVGIIAIAAYVVSQFIFVWQANYVGGSIEYHRKRSIDFDSSYDDLARASIIWMRQDVASLFALLATIASLLFSILVVLILLVAGA